MGSDFNVLLKEPVSNMFPQEKEEILSKQGEELSDLQEQLLRARESGTFEKILMRFCGRKWNFVVKMWVMTVMTVRT